ncbi:PIN domain-containing protein [Methylobacterium dankookense]|uniref:tRNA(fMet)-specific endonuclease VapC n=1 Tax=Methylobacterium dankookense TaxID=560405 RepID=A0A564FT26_9HYPH|nr:PIN domain-containing protein [Methylobacterium dankookense]GJD59331.1 tRNA(fMet)-specific endonuclease VapC [Methylobacterium dankookense]VUF10850.1 tRNA(fMet)-specific endonuclease VapC [Methylobacterium dankookense]
MTDRVFVDTNVFLYARDDRYPEKQAVARRWLAVLAAREAAVVSPQVLGEIHHTLLRGKVAVSPNEARRTTRAIETWSHGATDLELIHAAWSLREKTGFQWWDCVMLGAALRAGCRYLLSEDYQHGREVEGITILDPFRVTPETILTDH